MATPSSPDANELPERIAELMRSGDAASVLDLIDALTTERAALSARVEKQAAEIARMRRLLYGRRSERLSAEELKQLVLVYGVSENEASADEPTLPVPNIEDAAVEETLGEGATKRRVKHRGRTKLDPNLERDVTMVPVPESERTCKCCGAQMEVFDHVDHERVEYVPAKLVVHVERREKLGCKRCKGDAVTADRAAEPERPIRVGASLLAHLIESKCDDALPIHRQCDQLARLGFELPESTAYGYWKYATDLLLPVSDALLGMTLESPDWVGIDDTRLDVLDPSRKGGKYRGHLWCFRGSNGLIAYAFTQTWEAREVAPWFHAIGPHTHVQVDDYKGYGSIVETADGTVARVVDPDRRLGCMMHMRRRFYEALKLGDKRASKPVAWIKEIYEIEDTARGRPPDERHAIRQEHSIPRLDQLDAWVDAQENVLRKTGALAEAVRYAKQQRRYIRRCFSDGRFEIDNGAVERAIREPALGRKNFLFTGSTQAASRLAGAYSLVQTCRSLGIDTRTYLIDVITKLEQNWPARRLTELVPHRWALGREA